MAWSAHVYLERPPAPELDDIGTVLLSGPATRFSRVQLAIDGKAEFGLIEQIDPTDWEHQPDGLIPKVRISLASPGDERSRFKKLFEEAKQFYQDFGGWKTFKSGEWLWLIIHKSFTNYWERASAEYFIAKYPDLTVDKIARKLIAVADKNAAILGAVTGATVSTDEIVGLLTGFEGGIGLPANLAIAGASVAAEVTLLIRIHLQLVANLAKLYGAPLDPEDPEDILTILAFALGGAASDAAGRAGMNVGRKAAEIGVKRIFRKEFLNNLKRLSAKIGVKILKRSIVKYTVPAVSIAVGSTWNYVATRNVGRIAMRHFRQ
jgi:uncharacterized protein (DUF697 family)